MKNKILTKKRLKELLYYNSETGIFTRKLSLSPRTKSGDSVGVIKDNLYLEASVDGNKYLLHRLALLYVHGEWPEFQIDHINHIRGDNRIENLRSVTTSENRMNLTLRKTNKSGVTGVCWCKQTKCWSSEIFFNKKKIFLGRFKEFNDAVISRKMAEYKYNYHKNHGE